MTKRLAALLALVAASLVLQVSPASAAPTFTEPSQCTGKADTYFLFQYNDSGTVGLDSGCAEKNDVTSAQVPGLIANELHVSCSDQFPGGVPEKSDLGDPNRRVVAWLIIKDGGKKTCGVGTPVPAEGGTSSTLIGAAAIAGVGLLGYGVQRRRRTAELVG